MVGCCVFHYSLENLFDTLSCVIRLSVSLSLSYSCTPDTDSSWPPTLKIVLNNYRLQRECTAGTSVVGMIDNVAHRGFELKKYLSHTLEP